MVWVAGFRRELGLFSLASFFAAAPGADGTDGFVDSGETNVPFCGLVLVTFSFLTGDGGGGGDRKERKERKAEREEGREGRKRRKEGRDKRRKTKKKREKEERDRRMEGRGY